MVEGPQGGFKEITKLGGIVGYTTVNDRDEIGDFDYVEVGTASTNSPLSFEGASGGGLWKVQLNKKKDASLEEIEHKSPVLSGVVFYQESKTMNREILRCHGGKTIYLNLYDKIKGSCE